MGLSGIGEFNLGALLIAVGAVDQDHISVPRRIASPSFPRRRE
jgi:hypothetical protein